jgi:hypothetical protein
VLEEESKHKSKGSTTIGSIIRLKTTTTTNFGMALSRTIFTLPALFILSCTFALSVQIILFTFMNLVAIANDTTTSWQEQPKFIVILGAALAIPCFLYSLSSGMTMSWALVVDCWRGLSTESSLIQNMTYWNSQLAEWICLAVFVWIPLAVLFGTTFSENDDWYELSLGVWAASVGIFQTFYMLLIFTNEVAMSYSLLKKYGNVYDERQIPLWIKLVETSILLTQKQKYSGVKHERYLVKGNAMPPAAGYHASTLQPVQWNYTFGTRASFRMKRCYKRLEPPVRTYSIDEVFGNVMVLTKHNWSLERIWCMDRKQSAAISVTEGKIRMLFLRCVYRIINTTHIYH